MHPGIRVRVRLVLIFETTVATLAMLLQGVWVCMASVKYGAVTVFEHNLCSFQSEKKDLLFILTERYRVAILGYKQESGDIVTMAYGDVEVIIYIFCDCTLTFINNPFLVICLFCWHNVCLAAQQSGVPQNVEFQRPPISKKVTLLGYVIGTGQGL